MNDILQYAIGLSILILTLAAVGWLIFVAWLRVRIMQRQEATQKVPKKVSGLGGQIGGFSDEETDAEAAHAEMLARIAERNKYRQRSAGG